MAGQSGLIDSHKRDISLQLKDANTVLKMVKKRFSQRMLAGIITLYGKVRYSMTQYEHFCAMMRDSNSDIVLPSHSTV